MARTTGIGSPCTATGAAPAASSAPFSAARWLLGGPLTACHTRPQVSGANATAARVLAMSTTSVKVCGRSGSPIIQAARPFSAAGTCRDTCPFCPTPAPR